MSVHLPHCSLNLNDHVERFIQTMQVECLDKLIVMGTGHLDHLVRDFIEHYNRKRPHSSIGLRTPADRSPPASGRGPVRCRTRLGGVLRHYCRVAA
jgi:putative transposase